MKRLLMTLAVACMAAVPAAVLPAHPADAVVVDFICSGSADLHFSPGLTNTPRAVEVLYQSTVSCTITPDVRITGGSGFAIFDIPAASCTNLTTVENTATYNWFPRAVSSKVSYSATSLNLLTASQLVQTGRVSADYKVGDRVADTITLANLNLSACNTSTGLTFLSGPEALTMDTL